MNVHKGGEGHCKMKSAAPIFLLHPCTERGVQRFFSWNWGSLQSGCVVVVVTVVRVGRFVVWRESERRVCACVRVEHTVARLGVVSGGLAAECRVSRLVGCGAEARAESLYSQKYLRTPAAAHPLSQNYHPHRAPAISQLHHTRHRACAAPLSDNTNQYYAIPWHSSTSAPPR